MAKGILKWRQSLGCSSFVMDPTVLCFRYGTRPVSIIIANSIGTRLDGLVDDAGKFWPVIIIVSNPI
jgi:hypothetical protein